MSGYFGVKRALTMREILDVLEDSDDESENAQIRNNARNVVYIPPKVDVLSDEEDIDDTIIGGQENNAMSEVAGELEMEFLGGTEDISAPTAGESSESLLNKFRSKSSFPSSKWAHSRRPIYSNSVHDSTELMKDQAKLYQQLNERSPLDLFQLFFDEEIMELIMVSTNEYARQNNVLDNMCTIQLLERFIGFLIFTGYHTVPQYENYWSQKPDLGVPIVKKAMTRSEFRWMKKNLHVCNNNLDNSDRFAKLRPLLDGQNKKFLQFGIFSEHLSVDEQMVPYFGRHSCKMYIRNKPIRFGFKLWVLASSDGYMYCCMPYAGSQQSYNKEIGLGAHVVLSLLENVKNPERHYVYFDNFFTSFHLMCLMSEKKFKATGTVRKNRLPSNVGIKNDKTLKKGEYDFMFDRANEILIATWHDNAIVTLASNFDTIDPLTTARRYNRKCHKYVNVEEPNLIKNYNLHMGGVDMADNAISNYRINVRGKKWWWPLFSNAVDSAVVNAWKLHCFLSKIGKVRGKIQLEFRSEIARALLASEDEEYQQTESEKPRSKRQKVSQHVIVKQEEGKKRRCKQCHSHTPFMCKKCGVHLHTKCFEVYHNN